MMKDYQCMNQKPLVEAASLHKVQLFSTSQPKSPSAGTLTEHE